MMWFDDEREANSRINEQQRQIQELKQKIRAQKATMEILKLWMSREYGEELRKALHTRRKLARDSEWYDHEWTTKFEDKIVEAQLTKESMPQMAHMFLTHLGLQVDPPGTDGKA